jgi:hypothetical protein
MISGVSVGHRGGQIEKMYENRVVLLIFLDLVWKLGTVGTEVGDGPSYLSDYYALRIEICLSFALTTTFLSEKNNT